MGGLYRAEKVEKLPTLVIQLLTAICCRANKADNADLSGRGALQQM
ncbi:MULTISPECIES: hypothetical protein [Pseudomonas]|jgi:hypothetical protein|nr:hypothetical protein [Pseudomonas sp. MF6396]